MNQVNFGFRGFDAGLRFFLEGVQNPNLVADLHGVNHAVSVAAKPQRELEYAGAKPFERLGDIGMPAFGDDGKSAGEFKLRAGRKFLKVLPGGPDSRYRPCVSCHP